MTRTSWTVRIGKGAWRRVWLALGAMAALGGCGSETSPASAVSARQQAVTTTTAAVGTSTSNAATQHPHERKAFYGAGRHWVFYSDGASLVFQSSTDGAAWAAKTTVRVATTGATFSVWSDGTRVHYAYAAATANTPLYYRRGTPNADGTIAWTAEVVAVAAVSSTTYRYPTVTADATGVPWVGYLRDGTGSSDCPLVTKATAADGTWTVASGFPHQLSTTSSSTWTVVPVTLQAGRVLVVYGRGSAKPDSKVWTGTAWATARVGFTANSLYLAGTRLSVAAQGDDAHLVYLKVSAYAVQHVKWTYSATDTTYYGAWGGETAVQTAVTATSAPVAALDGATGELYAFWAGSPTANHLYYKKRSATGTWDASATDWVNEATEVLTGYDRLTAYAQAYGTSIGVVYSTRTASLYNVKQATLGLGPPPVCGNGVVEPGEQCETPFDVCCDGTTCQYKTSAVVCRAAAAGGCDVAETCPGTSAACPADAKRPNGYECRATAGDCDLAEVCDGSSVTCPADVKKTAGTTCRIAAGDCDLAEVCDGSNVACPADLKRAAGTSCRAAAGPCDLAETCDGAAVSCPSDVFAAAGAVGSPSCTPYLCPGGVATCGTSCTSSAQCAAGSACTGNICVASQVCGNGTVEGTEQCDAGGANGTTASCCTTSCTFKLAGTVCDSLIHSTCSGTSGACSGSWAAYPDVVSCP